MKAWVITLPKDVEWAEYEKELAAVLTRSQEMAFRVPKFHRSAKAGDRCFVCHRGIVRGWMEITGLASKQPWICTTTGRMWPGGTYVLRSGPFHYTSPVAMKGFRGIRAYAGGVE